jgi:Rieske 2Fe-2S family protein
MMPPLTAAMVQRIRRQATAATPALGAEAGKIPVERYFSHLQWEHEITTLFRAHPLIVAHSSELEPGEAMTHDSYGLPLLLCRDKDGALRCFMNVCRHRGMRLLHGAEAQPRASIVCPYHGWTYRLDGALRHIAHAEAFGPCAAHGRALQALPCAERHGLIWVAPDAQGHLDLDVYLGRSTANCPGSEWNRWWSSAKSKPNTRPTGS